MGDGSGWRRLARTSDFNQTFPVVFKAETSRRDWYLLVVVPKVKRVDGERSSKVQMELLHTYCNHVTTFFCGKFLPQLPQYIASHACHGCGGGGGVKRRPHDTSVSSAGRRGYPEDTGVTASQDGVGHPHRCFCWVLCVRFSEPWRAGSWPIQVAEKGALRKKRGNSGRVSAPVPSFPAQDFEAFARGDTPFQHFVQTSCEAARPRRWSSTRRGRATGCSQAGKPAALATPARYCKP